MFYLYILKSEKLSTYYIGVSSNVQDRLHLHNSGLVRSTKSKKPWVLIHKESYDTLSQARKREMRLKSLKKRKFVEKEIKHFKIFL